jgi:hypothetical protein
MWASFRSSCCQMICWYTLIPQAFWCSLFSYSWMQVLYSQVIIFRLGHVRCSSMLNAWVSGWCTKELTHQLNKSIKVKILKLIRRMHRQAIRMKKHLILSTELRRLKIRLFRSQHSPGNHITPIREVQTLSISIDFIKPKVTTETWQSQMILVPEFFTRFSIFLVDHLPSFIFTMEYRFFYTLFSHYFKKEESVYSWLKSLSHFWSW